MRCRAGHPAAGKGMVNGQPTAYIVQVGNVSEGITDPAVLAYGLTLPVQMRQQMQAAATDAGVTRW